MQRMATSFGLSALIFLVGCAGQPRNGNTSTGRGEFGHPHVDPLTVKASSTLSADHRIASILFEGVSASASGAGVGERFATLELPVKARSAGRVDIHLGVRGGGMVTRGVIELWQMSPKRELLWKSGDHNGNFFVRSVVSIDVHDADLVVGQPAASRMARASFYLRAVSTGPEGAAIELDSVDAAFDASHVMESR